MEVQTIQYQKTGYFSQLICDYIDGAPIVKKLYSNYPSIEGFEQQIHDRIASKIDTDDNRSTLSNTLNKQYKNLIKSDLTLNNITLLKYTNTYTITTGHQLNIFSGPLYFLYKIVSTINLTKQLKLEYPDFNFVPVYWMATEDHDFEEINYFNFKGNKLKWNKKSGGPVGRFQTEGLDAVFETFSKELNNSKNATYLKELFKNAYLNNNNLADATRYLVNELFGEYGLVIIDGDDVDLKRIFAPYVLDELLNQTSFKNVTETNKKLEAYNIQVNPREINMFYILDGVRERIIKEGNDFIVNNTNISFSKEEIKTELNTYPERFSPNVLMRPLYEEIILPNLCYIGGGGELAYWFQLKESFSAFKVPFPILLLRNSALLMTDKQAVKMDKLQVSLDEIFLSQQELINKKTHEISTIKIDFSEQRTFLQEQFKALKLLATQTDVSFLGAVNAQEKKQLNGLDTLEKRLLKAQKRKHSEELTRIIQLQNELFPKGSLEERTKNFSEVYLDLGRHLIPILMDALKPLDHQFTVITH